MRHLKGSNDMKVLILSVWMMAVILVMVFLYPLVAVQLSPAVNLIISVLWWYVLLIPIVFFMRRDNEKPRDIGFTKEQFPKQLLCGVLIAIATVAVFSMAIPLLLGVSTWNYSGFAGFNVLLLLYSIVAQIITVGIVEEVAFRGYMFKKLQDSHSTWIAIAITAIIFGAKHIPSFIIAGAALPLWGGWYSVLMATLIGVVYGILRAKGATMVTLIFAHALHNAAAAAILGVFLNW